MTGTIKKVTVNYNFRIPIFDSPGWGREMERNFDIIDATLLTVSGLTNIKGTWTNSTAYASGDRLVDVDTYTVFMCVVPHTSAAVGSFQDDRTAHPTYWVPVSSTAVNKGQWTTATDYNVNEFVYDANRFGIVVQTYTSGATYDADVADGKIVTLIDISAQYATVLAKAAAASASAAAALVSEGNASNSADAAAASASAASDDADAVAADKATVAADKATVAADKATVAADKNTTITSMNAAQAAQTAAESARDQALTAFDNFDDRMLGSKAADPTTDNDGNPLQGGAIYFNTTTGVMMVYDSSAGAWTAAYVSGSLYYTKTVSDARFLGIAAQAADSAKLGGVAAALYARKDVAGTFTTRQTFVGNGTGNSSIGTATGSLGEIMVQGNGTGAAMMTFHRPSAFAAYFGIDTDNKWKVGGWSYGAVSYELWHEGNLAVSQANVANAVVQRDAAGDISARLLKSEYAVTSGIVSYIMTQQAVGVANNYVRPSTPAQVAAALYPYLISPIYNSPGQSIVAGGAGTLAHGLGAMPNFFDVKLYCAVAEAGYSVGDYLEYAFSRPDGGNANAFGVAITSDASNIYYRYGSSSNPFYINNKSTGAAVVITAANWRLAISASLR